MASINKVTLIGNVGQEPDVRATPDGQTIVNFSLATNERWMDKKTNEKKELTEWHRVTVYGRLAETAAQFIKKGAQVYVEGRIRSEKWTDNSGVERYGVKIICDNFQLLGSRGSNSYDDEQGSSRGGYNGGGRSQTSNSTSSYGGSSNYGSSNFDDDVPF